MRRRTTAALGVVVLLAGGYATADAVDALPRPWPGALTTDEPWAVPSPFPTVVLDPPPQVPLVLAAPPTAAPAPDPARLDALVEPVLADPRVSAGVGAVVVDVATGEVLHDVAAATPRTPASTVKLLTATAALTSLGPQTRLATRVLAGRDLATDAVAAGVATGTVHLVGGGDVLLVAGQGDPDAVAGRAGIADLAQEAAAALAERGVARVRVALDDTLFTGPRVAAGWGPVDLGGGFVAPVSALAVERGVLPGRTARDTDPGRTAALAFAEALAERGIAVEGEVVRAAAPPDAAELAVVESATVAELVAHLLEESDNDVAEALGRLVAIAAGEPADFTGATRAVPAAVERQGVDVSGVRMADASGLSEASAVPPLVLGRLLALTADPARPDLRPVATGMPVAGLEGTLAGRFAGPSSPAAGVVRAKTGTLVTVVALAGLVLDADDRLLAFAVVADAVPVGGVGGVREVLDGWVNRLAACGCTAAPPAAAAPARASRAAARSSRRPVSSVPVTVGG